MTGNPHQLLSPMENLSFYGGQLVSSGRELEGMQAVALTDANVARLARIAGEVYRVSENLYAIWEKARQALKEPEVKP